MLLLRRMSAAAAAAAAACSAVGVGSLRLMVLPVSALLLLQPLSPARDAPAAACSTGVLASKLAVTLAAGCCELGPEAGTVDAAAAPASSRAAAVAGDGLAALSKLLLPPAD
jgi:hypothetical protein